jgi:predicted DNA-binding protein (UPF0251 family)
MAIIDCNTCEEKNTCTELCDAAQAYADQDYTTFPNPIYLEFPELPEPKPLDVTWPEMMGGKPDLEEDDFYQVVKHCDLTRPQQDVLRRYDWQGETFEKIAKDMNVNISTIHKHRQRAARKVIQLLWSKARTGEMKGLELPRALKDLASMGLRKAMDKYAHIESKARKVKQQMTLAVCY